MEMRLLMAEERIMRIYWYYQWIFLLQMSKNHLLTHLLQFTVCCFPASKSWIKGTVIREHLLLACALRSAPCCLYLGLLHGWVSVLLILVKAVWEEAMPHRLNSGHRNRYRHQWVSCMTLKQTVIHFLPSSYNLLHLLFYQITEKEMILFQLRCSISNEKETL